MARHPERGKRPARDAARNASSGPGGNDWAKGPVPATQDQNVPVRKPKLTVPVPKPKEPRKDPSPKKVREPKPRAVNVRVVKELARFNRKVLREKGNRY